MKLSMMTYTMARGPWGKNPTLSELLALVRELGLDGIDWVGTHGFKPRDIRKTTNDLGLRNVCYTFFVNELCLPSREEREKGLGLVREGLDTAAALGADKVMVVIAGLKDTPRERARAHAIDGLAGAVELGRSANIAVTIEHFPGAQSPFVTSSDMNAAIAAVPGLKITFDNGNALTGGEAPADAFNRSKGHILHAHFKDWTVAEDGLLGLDGRRYKGALIGEGIVDPKPCIEAMATAGYAGYINVEYEGNEYDPAQAMRQAVPMLRRLIEASGPLASRLEKMEKS